MVSEVLTGRALGRNWDQGCGSGSPKEGGRSGVVAKEVQGVSVFNAKRRVSFVLHKKTTFVDKNGGEGVGNGRIIYLG